jgi:hypothetical protein
MKRLLLQRILSEKMIDSKVAASFPPANRQMSSRNGTIPESYRRNGEMRDPSFHEERACKYCHEVAIFE